MIHSHIASGMDTGISPRRPLHIDLAMVNSILLTNSASLGQRSKDVPLDSLRPVPLAAVSSCIFQTRTFAFQSTRCRSTQQAQQHGA